MMKKLYYSRFRKKIKMDSLLKLLFKIKENPTLYFGGRENISLLRAFIDGYIEKQWETDKNSKLTFALFGFQEFVQRKFAVVSVHSWDRIIDFYSTSDREAFGKFFILLEEYLENKNDI